MTYRAHYPATIVADQPGERLTLARPRIMGGFRRLSFDRERQHVEVRRALGAGRGRRIPVRALRSFRVRISEHKGLLLLVLSIAYREDGRNAHEQIVLRVKHLDREQEALDLLFRIAQIIEWPSYALLHKDEHSIDIELRPPSQGERHPMRSGAGDDRAISEITERADYEADFIPGIEKLAPTSQLAEVAGARPKQQGFLAPRGVDLRAFTPPLSGTPALPGTGTQIETWSPGQWIKLRKPAAHWLHRAVFFCYAPVFYSVVTWAIFACLAMALLFFLSFLVALPFTAFDPSQDTIDSLAKWSAIVSAGLGVPVGIGVGGVFLTRHYWRELQDKVIEFVWPDRTLSVRVGARTKRIPFQDIHNVTLLKRFDKGKATRAIPSKFSLTVQVDLAAGDEPLVSTREGTERWPELPSLRTFAGTLARALDVPYREQ